MARNPDTRDQIIEAAIALFAARGYERTSLREIADRLGFTKAALYYHFSSKDALARAILEPMLSDVDAVLDEAAAGGGVPPRLLFERLFDTYHRHLPVFALMLRDASIMGALELEAWTDAWLERAVTLLVGADAAPERRIRAVAALGVLRGTVVLAATLPPDLVRATLVEAACDALGPD